MTMGNGKWKGERKRKKKKKKTTCSFTSFIILIPLELISLNFSLIFCYSLIDFFFFLN